MALAMKAVMVVGDVQTARGGTGCRVRACEATRDAGGRGDRCCIGRRLPDKIVPHSPCWLLQASHRVRLETSVAVAIVIAIAIAIVERAR